MDKVLLISILAAHVVIPVMYSQDENPKRGLSKALLALLVFNVVYALALFFIYPRLGVL